MWEKHTPQRHLCGGANLVCIGGGPWEKASLPVCKTRQVSLNGFLCGQKARVIISLAYIFSQSFASFGTGCPLESSGKFGLDTHAGLLWACFLVELCYLTLSMDLCFWYLPCCEAPGLLGSHNWCVTRDLYSLFGSGHTVYAILSLGYSLAYMPY